MSSRFGPTNNPGLARRTPLPHKRLKLPDAYRSKGSGVALNDELITVFRTGNPVLIAVAKAALDAEHIRYVVEGEGVQDLIGMGRFPAGYNAVTGPVRIQVTAENAERAREALIGVDES
jgi:putative signal transducing protein